MKIEKLNLTHLDMLLEYLDKVLKEDPDEVFFKDFNREDLKSRIEKEEAPSLVAIIDNKIVGRIEYHTHKCLVDGYVITYIELLYVLKEYRKHKVGTSLIKKMEEVLKQEGVNEYFLLEAQNEESLNFYKSLESTCVTKEIVFRKDVE